MFKKFFRKIAHNHHQTLQSRLEEFDDPIAKRIDWSPLKGGGTNFKTHTLVKDIYRMSYKASKGALLFGAVFAVFGAGIPGWILYENFIQGYSISHTENLIIGGFGVLFLGVGIFMLKRFTNPVTFDKHIGFFGKGKKEPELYGRDNPKEALRISDIHALQLVTERVKGDKSSYFSYEINIVTKDGKRMNVIDHGDHQSIYEDIQTLSTFLDVPIWHLNAKTNRA
ncbi:hypothetical protein [Gracilimonas tropica]|uniref:hypothetical protein n=1 Tax=Gracilimonas tropica TaxID=454600 RepID=UPI00037A2B98|nr:hypothetical protein [Gracilimonas tropica]